MNQDLLVNIATVVAFILAVIAIMLKFSNNSNIKNLPELKPLKKGTGNKSIILQDAGVNKVTVLATIRQILGVGLVEAKNIVENTPSVIIEEVSEEEASITKEALDFVGATVEIK